MKITEKDIKNLITEAIGEIWAVKIIEYERRLGWDRTYVHYFDNEKEANQLYEKYKPKEGRIPNYYREASKPVKVKCFINEWFTMLTD